MVDLLTFLQEEDSIFGAELGQRGGYIKLSTSGESGSTKSFRISLEALYETLQDIYNHLDVFAKMQDYEEKPWRDNGALYFTDEVANATITVQTKPLFSTLSKLIKWSNPDECRGVSTDQHIVLNVITLKRTLTQLLSVIKMFTPKPIVKQTSAMLPLQVIYYGAPGTGKSYKIKNLEKGQGVKPVRTTFHPDSDYATFVGAYKPTMIDNNGSMPNILYSIDELAKLLKDSYESSERKSVGVDSFVLTYAEQIKGTIYFA